jgi:hypothetical protein
MIDFVNLKIKLTQSFECDHKSRVCVFIDTSAHTYIRIYICTVFKKNRERNLRWFFVLLPNANPFFQQSISCTLYAVRIAQQQGNKYARNPVYTYTRTKRSKEERGKWRAFFFFWISSSKTSLGVNLFSSPLYIFTTLHY